MSVKKFAILGVIALVVIGCVVAAGCTSAENDPIAGDWVCLNVDIGNGVVADMTARFAADGTGTCLVFPADSPAQEETVVWTNLGGGIYRFDISVPDLGVYTVEYTLSSDGCSMTDASGRTWNRVPDIRPLAADDAMVGTWAKKSVKNGSVVENVFIFHGDGSGYWMVLSDTPSVSLIRMRYQDLGKTGDTTYVGRCSAGRIYEIEYLPETDTFVIDGGTSAFSRLDPLVGIWSGDSSRSGAVVSTIIKSDGTGVTTTAYANGTAQVCRLTWIPADDGSYAIMFSDGDSAVYTLGPDGRSLSSSSGLSRTKQFMDSYFLLPITGAWYRADGNAAAIVNADRTGTIRYGDTLRPFTWDYVWNATDVIDFTVTYAGGDSAGTAVTWTYNLTSDSLVSADGTRFTRPAATVDGLITLN
ncbi:MAG TPA: hypothetical protein O0X27_02995 [Methanocorpusculum sp.]|nr:hypothetical protein [Methanocorpusculum sp.]